MEWIRAIQRQIAKKPHLAGWYSSHPTAFSTLGGCQGGVDQSNPEAGCKENHTWQGGIPPIQLHFPPWEAARVEWIRAIQRQIARKITPGRVVFLLLYSSYTNPAQISIFPHFCLQTGHSVTLQPPGLLLYSPHT